MYDLVWLLLPVAAISGWGAARLHYSRNPPNQPPTRQPDYLKGLNYLVNEQPDKALDAFIQALEVDTDTVETHLALGGLFRRRGEIDRAIRIHENLTAQPQLTRTQLEAAHTELARDYMRAGLLDRAEELLASLAKTSADPRQELEALLEIYQQEKEWEKAIEVAARLDEAGGQDTRVLCAHFCCELAETYVRSGDRENAMRCIDQAIRHDPGSVRASMLRGELAMADGDYGLAVKEYERVVVQDIAYLPAVLDVIGECYRHLDDLPGLRHYLQQIRESCPASSVTAALVDVMDKTDSPGAADKLLMDALRDNPTIEGIGKLVERGRDGMANLSDTQRSVLHASISALSGSGAHFRCRRCGYEARNLYWCCPGCRSWGLVKPEEGSTKAAGQP